MALTITPVRSFVVGDRRMVIADVTFDSSYATGGEALVASDLGLKLGLDSIHAASTTRGHTCPYDYVNGKLMAFSGGTEVSAATDLSRVTTRVTAIGRGYGL